MRQRVRAAMGIIAALNGLQAGTARPELEISQDADSHQQEPGREQDVQEEAEHRQRQDGDEDNGDDPKHVDRSPFTMN